MFFPLGVKKGIKHILGLFIVAAAAEPIKRNVLQQEECMWWGTHSRGRGRQGVSEFEANMVYLVK